MLPKRLTDALLVCGQISVQDVDRFAQAGVRLILNNRPDGEEPGQPTSAEIRARAEAKGVVYRHIPVSGGRFDDAAIAAFGAAMDEAPGEVLAFCRSGARATTLWALSQAGRRPAAEILQAAQRAGYDLSAQKTRIEQRAGAVPAPSRTPERAERFDSGGPER
jgi:sulfide:quinone oxidoreductase